MQLYTNWINSKSNAVLWYPVISLFISASAGLIIAWKHFQESFFEGHSVQSQVGSDVIVVPTCQCKFYAIYVWHDQENHNWVGCQEYWFWATGLTYRWQILRFYIVFELWRMFISQQPDLRLRWGFGSKCSIVYGQVIYIEKSKLNIANIWLIHLDCDYTVYSIPYITVIMFTALS